MDDLGVPLFLETSNRWTIILIESPNWGVRQPPESPPTGLFFRGTSICEFRARLLQCETYWHPQTQFYRHIFYDFYDFCWIPNNQPYQPKPANWNHVRSPLTRFTVKPSRSHRRWPKLESYESLIPAPPGQKTQRSTWSTIHWKNVVNLWVSPFESPLKSLNLFLGVRRKNQGSCLKNVKFSKCYISSGNRFSFENYFVDSSLINCTTLEILLHVNGMYTPVIGTGSSYVFFLSIFYHVFIYVWSYGIFTYIWWMFMVNVGRYKHPPNAGKYTIPGW